MQTTTYYVVRIRSIAEVEAVAGNMLSNIDEVLVYC